MDDFVNTAGQTSPLRNDDVVQTLTISEDRRRDELDGLLRMAEELQEGLENASQRFLTNSLFLFVILLLSIASIVAAAFLTKDVAYKIGIEGLLVILVLVAAFVLTRSQARFQLHQRRDKNALNEVLAILQEVEPVLRATSDWSRLDEAAFRIRLSRFNVGRGSPSSSGTSNRGIDKFTRTMRFLLEEGNAHYRELVERLFQNIDVAVKNLMEARNFDEVVSRAGARLEVLPDDVDFQRIVKEGQVAPPARAGGGSTLQTHVAWAQWGGVRNYAIFSDGRVVMTKGSKRDFDARQEQLRIQLGSS